MQTAGGATPIRSNWTPFELNFDLPAGFPAHFETDDGVCTSGQFNPWLDYRLDLELTPPWSPNASIVVPGFFVGTGQVGTTAGRRWRARVLPFGATGLWTYRARLWRECGANVLPANQMPTSAPVLDQTGQFLTVAAAASAPGFLARGPLRAVGDAYYQFENGSHFLKVGSGGPENFLAFHEFEGWARHGDLQPNLPGGVPPRLKDCSVGAWNNRGMHQEHLLPGGHRYEAHLADWTPQDPVLPGNAQDQGKAIIGALNYLANQGVNSLYMLLMNLGGDSRDVAPFASIGTDPCTPNASTRNYSVRRMQQWYIVFRHAMQKGIALGLVLGELEINNLAWLGGAASTGGNALSIERRLFLKQMVAMYGSLPAIRWILTEENRDELSAGSQYVVYTRAELRALAEWIQSWDVYDHPITVHTTGYPWIPYDNILAEGDAQSAWLGGTSLQISGEKPDNVFFQPAFASTNYGWMTGWTQRVLDHWATQYGRGRTVVDVDEIGHIYWGAVHEDPNDATVGSSYSFNDPSLNYNPIAAPQFNSPADRRKRILYDVLFKGANLSWYHGRFPELVGGLPAGGDHSLESLRTRGWHLFRFSRYARELIETRAGWWTYEPWDGILSTGCSTSDNTFMHTNTNVPALQGPFSVSTWTSAPYNFSPTADLDGDACDLVYGRPRVFAKQDGGALIHYPSLPGGNAGTVSVAPTHSTPGSNFLYTAFWFDPRTGLTVVDPNGGQPPFDGSPYNPTPVAGMSTAEDWVLIIDRIQ